MRDFIPSEIPATVTFTEVSVKKDLVRNAKMQLKCVSLLCDRNLVDRDIEDRMVELKRQLKTHADDEETYAIIHEMKATLTPDIHDEHLIASFDDDCLRTADCTEEFTEILGLIYDLFHEAGFDDET